jgi:hypothetical protein
MMDLVPHADDIDATVVLLIGLGKAALKRAWDQRGSHWQNCEKLLLRSMKEFEAFGIPLSGSNQDMGP